MIKINLLPKIYIVPEKTPFPRFMLIVANAIAGALVIFGVLWCFLQIKSVDGKISDAKKKQQELAPRVKQYETENARLIGIQAKLKEMESVIGRSTDAQGKEFEWWRALDAIWDVIHRHKGVWIDGIQYFDAQAVQGAIKKIEPDRKSFPDYAVHLKFHVAGQDATALTKFRMAMKEHPLLQKIFPAVNYDPQWKLVAEEKYVEEYSMTEEIDLFGPEPAAPAGQPK